MGDVVFDHWSQVRIIVDEPARGTVDQLLSNIQDFHGRGVDPVVCFDAIFGGEAVRVIRTPLQAPNANAHAHIERWVGSVRRECLDRLLIIVRRQLERVLRVYVRHYNEQRPHRALDLQAPEPRTIPPARCGPLGSPTAIRRQDLLGGLIHEYEAAAA